MSKYSPKYRSNKTVLTAFVAILLVFIPVAGAFGFQMAESGGSTNGLFHASAGGNIGNNIQQAFGWDPATGTYVQATLGTHVGTNSVTISFPTGDKISWVWIFTDNQTWNDQALVHNSSIYSYINVKVATTSHSNLSDVQMFLGHAVNASVSTAIGDKGVTNFILDKTFYSSTVNNLGTAQELSVPQMLGSSFSSTAIYFIGLSTTGKFNTSANTSVGSTVNIDFTQYFGHTEQYNILSDVEAIMVVIAIIEIVILYAAIPRHKEWGE